MIELCFGCENLVLRYFMLLITTMIAVFFGGPASLLTYIHIRNYSAGKTTNERFGKGAAKKGGSEISESLGSVSDLRSLKSNEQEG